MAQPHDEDERRRGRPRDERADAAIHAAALALVGDLGIGGLRMAAVAARAGVSKATLYRRFPNKAALLVAVFDSLIDVAEPIPDTGSFERDLREEIRRLCAIAADPRRGPAARAFLVEHDRVRELHAEVERALQRLQARLAAMARRAAVRGELARRREPQQLLDLVLGPLLMRWLLHHAPPDDRYASALARHVATYLRRSRPK